MAVSQNVQFGCCCLLICTSIYLFISSTSSSSSGCSSLIVEKPAGEKPVRPPRKNILIYTPTQFFSREITAESFLTNCTFSKGWCSISGNIRDLTRADAVVIHNRNFDMRNNLLVHKKRNADTPYVIWSMESPSNDNLISLKNFINWTMTYRRDADVSYPYGRMERRKRPISIDFEAIWSMKNESLPPATWIASNCNTPNGRREIIARLEWWGLKLDKWGNCGLPAPGCQGSGLHGERCTTDLVAQYKFYIAFENSNCVDYVTEKFYMTMRTRMAVPVVMNRKTYEDLGIPSSSFIALSDYASAVDAVREMERIAGDKKSYLEYHKWREDYEVISDHNDGNGFCELCRKLAERSHMSTQERETTRKWYRSVQEWHSKGMCNNAFTFN